MSASKPVHPIRRVRQELKSTPEEMGLRKFATSAGFAKFLGRSSSLIRNVECGITNNWQNLADVIQRKTKVSSSWLRSNPGPNDPILDIRNKPWSPSRALDPLRPRGGMPDWRMVLDACPGTVPHFIAQLVEAQLVLELSLGNYRFLENLVSVLHQSRTFENPAIEEVRKIAVDRINDVMGAKLWGKDSPESKLPNKELGSHLTMMLQEGLDKLTLEQMQVLLREEGFGWTSKLTNAASKGTIEKAKNFYARNFPEFRETEEDTDAELD